MVAQPDRLSVADYLALEAVSPTKHEYWDGYLVAMAGASDAHVAIVGNLFAALWGHIAPPCRKSCFCEAIALMKPDEIGLPGPMKTGRGCGILGTLGTESP